MPATRFTLRLFGRFAAELNGEPLTDLRLREGERLLAFLALHHGEDVSYQMLAQWFWPAEARHGDHELTLYRNTRQALFSLRRALGPEGERVMARGKGHVCLNLAGADVDTIAFDERISYGDIGSLSVAVDLYRDRLLAGWQDAWITEPRSRRAHTYERTLRRLIALSRASGDTAASVRHLRTALAHWPEEEGLWRELLESLAQLGSAADVEAAYEALCARLDAQQCGPAPETQILIASLRANWRRPAQCDEKQGVLEREEQADLPATPAPQTTVALEPVGGVAPINSPFYIERDADAELATSLRRGDMIVLITGGRQMGKTSLLARGLHALRRPDARVAQIDMQMFNEDQFATPDALLFALATAIALQLDIDPPTLRSWNPEAGANINLETFLRRRVLAAHPEPLALALDEVDRLFTCPYGGDVFGLFRSWYNRRGLDPEGPWSRLTLIMAYATEARLFITNLNQSPFNVGTRIDLEDFTPAELAELNRRHGSPLRDPAELARFHRLVGGHPYLSRRGLDEMVHRGIGLTALESVAPCDTGPFGDHLRRLLICLTRDAVLTTIVRNLLGGKPCDDAGGFYRLRSAGVVAGRAAVEARLRCELYATYLTEHLRP
jgi:DNA-binding SARP family transcriptional activator